MSIAVACPACGSQMKILAKYAGQRIKCPDCGKPLTVPEAPRHEEAIAFATTEPVARPRPPAPADDDEDDSDDEEPRRRKSFPMEARSVFGIVAVSVHVLAAAALAVLVILPTRPMALFCIVPGALSGCAAVAALRDRPVTLYVAFGVLMGYVFWQVASAVNQGQYLDLIVACLLAAGAAWLLYSPDLPAVLFTGILVVLLAALTLAFYHQRNDWDDPERIRRSAINGIVVLGTGLVYVSLGFYEASLRRKEARARRRRRRRPQRPY